MEIDVSPEAVERQAKLVCMLPKFESKNAAAMLRKLRADNEALRAELEQARQYNETLTQRCVEDTAQLAAAEQRAEANAKDAERYQWVREVVNRSNNPRFKVWTKIYMDAFEDFAAMDAAIDAAIAQAQEERNGS